MRVIDGDDLLAPGFRVLNRPQIFHFRHVVGVSRIAGKCRGIRRVHLSHHVRDPHGALRLLSWHSQKQAAALFRRDIERVVDPVVMTPLRREWETVRAEMDTIRTAAESAPTAQTRRNALARLAHGLCEQRRARLVALWVASCLNCADPPSRGRPAVAGRGRAPVIDWETVRAALLQSGAQ